MNGGLIELQQALTGRLKARLAYKEVFERFEAEVQRSGACEVLAREVQDARQRFEDAETRLRELTGRGVVADASTRFS